MEWLKELDWDPVRAESDPSADCRLIILSDSEPVFKGFDNCSNGSMTRA